MHDRPSTPRRPGPTAVRPPRPTTPTPGAVDRPAPPPGRLPAEVSRALLDNSAVIASRLSRRLVTDLRLPEEFRTRSYLRLVSEACREGLRALLRQLHDGRRPHPAELVALGLAGAHQAEMGVPLEVLLSGYRLAAKVVWREVVDEAARRGGLDPATVVLLSEQVLEYLDEISGAVGSAYLETRERLLRQRDRDRDLLLRRLLGGDDTDEVRRLAGTVGLELTPPYRVLACALAAPDADTRLGRAWRGAGAVLVADEPGTWIALVSPAAALDALVAQGVAALGDVRGPGGPALVVAAGPVADTLAEVAGAARRARRALAVGRRLDQGRLLHDERDLTLDVLHDADPAAMRRHVEHVLGPLLDGGSARRRDLLETLAAAVDARSVTEVASSSGLHRHTVVYRLGRVRDLLGVDLDDPGQRHRVWLALRCLRLLEAGATAVPADASATSG